MRSLLKLVFVLVAATALAGAALAADKPATAAGVTLSGALQCAKCTLKQADAKACQDVLVVAAKDGGAATQYYLVKNPVAEKFGHVCQGQKNVVATGSVSEKDGKKWLAATRIEESKS